MSEHTKGPWVADFSGGRRFYVMAKSEYDKPFGETKWYVCSFGNLDDPLRDADRANARLIAAAPDMYEVCKAILAMRSDVGALARAAIAKVEGE